MENIDADQLPELDLEIMDRRIIMSKLYDAIDYLHEKAANKRIQEKELKFVKLRVDMFKAMAYIATSYNALSKDMELEELRAEIEELKEMLKNDS